MLKSSSRSTLTGVNHVERIARLSEKLGDLKIITEAEKIGRLSQIEKKLRIMEESLGDYQDNFCKKLGALKDSTTGLQKQFSEDKEEYDRHYTEELHDITLLEKKLQSLYDKEKSRRKEYENRLTANVEEKTQILKNEIQKENQIMSESFSQLNQIYESDLSKLQLNLAQEIEEREECDNKIWDYTNSEIRKLNESVGEYGNAKEESEKKVYATIREAVAKIKTWIDDEKTIRETTHEKMINLLEEACKNLTKVEYD